MKKLLLVLLFIIATKNFLQGQDLTVKSFEMSTTDISASVYSRNDGNLVACALIKVQLPLINATFEGEIVGDVENKNGEYWVYLVEGSKYLLVKQYSVHPLKLQFSNYGIDRVQSKCTYVLCLNTPVSDKNEPTDDGMQYFSLSISPSNATVLIDGVSQELRESGSLIIRLNRGKHDYVISAPGYKTKTGSFVIDNKKVSISEELVSTKAHLLVTCETDGASVFINDEKKSTNSIWDGYLMPASYLVEVKKDGYRNQQKTITLLESQDQKVNFSSLLAIVGNLDVAYDPIDAEVWLDGKKIGTSPDLFKQITIGPHNVEIRKEGYLPKTINVSVLEGQTAKISGNLSHIQTNNNSSIIQSVTDNSRNNQNRNSTSKSGTNAYYSDFLSVVENSKSGPGCTPLGLEIICANGETAATNNSLYNDYFPKGGQAKPAMAYDPWKALYDAVPSFNLALYLCGEKILVAKLENAVKAHNQAEQQRFAKELEKLMDDRIAYGFATKTVPREAILLKKIDYYQKYDLDSSDKTVYDLYGQLLSEFRGGAQPYYITQWCDLALKQAKAGVLDKHFYIEDYMKSVEYLDETLDRYVLRYTDDTNAVVNARVAGQDTTKLFKAATTTKLLMDQARSNKMALTQKFASSGYADVNTLVNIFTPQVEEKKSDLAFLNNVSKLLGRSAEGRETDLYTHVADYSYQIQPSMEAAKGLAKAALKQKDIARALQYYDEALDRAIQPDDKTEILMYEAAIYQQQGNKGKARDVLRKSLSIDPDQDTPHVMIANLYASSSGSCGEDKPALKQLVWVAAYQEMQQAIAHASSDEKRAAYQRTCATYKGAFPAKGDLFMQAGKTPGQSHTLGGWMNLTVTIQCQ